MNEKIWVSRQKAPYWAGDWRAEGNADDLPLFRFRMRTRSHLWELFLRSERRNPRQADVSSTLVLANFGHSCSSLQPSPSEQSRTYTKTKFTTRSSLQLQKHIACTAQRWWASTRRDKRSQKARKSVAVNLIKWNNQHSYFLFPLWHARYRANQKSFLTWETRKLVGGRRR